MRFVPTRLAGVYIVEQERQADERGFFARTWCAQEFADHNLESELSQCSVSFNHRRATLRGLHYQAPPFAEVKLVRCTRGALYDVAVDLRPDSPTYRGWIGVELTEHDGRALYIPRGFAHGFYAWTTPPRSRTRCRRRSCPRPRGASAGTIRSTARSGPARSRSSPRVTGTTPMWMPRCSRSSVACSAVTGAEQVRRLIERLDAEAVAAEMHATVRELYPIARSITGDGLRQSLRILQAIAPMSLHEVPTGTPVLDWVVPREWNLEAARLLGPDSEVVVDAKRSNLHVLGYSVPFRGKVSLEELERHLHSLPDQPSLIPYRTSYYKEDWGFCLSHEQRARLRPGEYDVQIDTRLADGSLTYGELVLPGESADEVLVSAHCCHPSLANDNLSGMVLAATLARLLRGAELRYTYRFVFVPGTIGSITWLALNEDRVERIVHGLVVACVGDAGRLTYKRSRRGNADIDRAVAHVLAHSGEDYEIRDFTPTATTSGSTARRASTCRWAPSPARRTGNTPSTTPRATRRTWSAPTGSLTRCSATSRCARSWKATSRTRTCPRRASRSSASAASTARWGAGATPWPARWRCSGC
jgi:dTDP-4-dehydrorhamnose 3,5-epimerase